MGVVSFKGGLQIEQKELYYCGESAMIKRKNFVENIGFMENVKIVK